MEPITKEQLQEAINKYQKWISDKNPWEDENGSALPGKTQAYLQWYRIKELLRRKTLPHLEQVELLLQDKHMSAKMQSPFPISPEEAEQNYWYWFALQELQKNKINK